MRKRSTEILEKLNSSDSRVVESKKIIKDYRISLKTLKADIVEINDFLNNQRMSSVKLNEDGNLVLLEKNTTLIQNAIENMDTYSYKMSREERQIYIIATLIKSDQFVTMQNLAKELNVSRNTILTDFEMVKDYFQAFQIDILMKSSKGIKVDCKQEKVEELLLELFRTMDENFESGSFFRKKIDHILGMHIRIRDMKEKLQSYMQENQLLFSDQIFSEIVLYFYIIINSKKNSQKEFRLDRFIQEPDHLDKIEQIFVWFGQDYDVFISHADICKFQQYIEEHQLYVSEKEIDDIELYGIISYFLLMVGNEIGINLQTDTVLIESLLEHIKTFKNWRSYDFDMPFSDELPIPEQVLNRAVEKYGNILEKYIGYPLNQEMKESIVVHICASIVRNRSYLDMLNVVIICPGSMATGKYVEAQVKNYFSFHIVGVIQSGKLEDFLGRNIIDFVISTVEVETEEVPVVKVDVLLTMDDINAIQNVAFLLGKKSMQKQEIPSITHDQNRFLENVRSFLQKLTFGNRKEFFDEVYKLMSEKLYVNHGVMLTKLLKKEKILIENSFITWENGIKKAAEILEKDGCIGSEYAKQAIENVKEYGDYIVISKGVALAHAGKGCKVYKDGLSLLVCPQGVEFSEKNRVYLLFCFATQGENDYLQLFHEIISIGKNQEILREIIKQEDVASVFRILLFL
ncbi:MAG: PTS sugar transporter subunit IIA [Lachnospiraceae bacterium]|nr:PTS sugar transporter subunit IIA [Lachnospiraceae bacterium]